LVLVFTVIISDPNLRKMCYAVVKQDPSICDQTGGNGGVLPPFDVKDLCYEKVAVVKRDSSLCDKIQNQNHKDWCYRDVDEARK